MIRKFQFILFTSLLLSFQSALAQSRCGHEKIYNELLKSEEFVAFQENLRKETKADQMAKSQTVFVIPTVIHVLYKSNTENISNAQITSQINVLNKDFNKLNSDTSLVEPEFSIADVGIEFCLAQRDPNGNVTSGISRTFTSIDNICDENSTQYYQLAPAWNTQKYLNIWVCDAGVIAGFAFPPGSASEKDGVVINYDSFGTIGTAEAPYNKGRTATHEVGHWLNLLHIFGTPNTCIDDGISDTPIQKWAYLDCPPRDTISCESKDMVTNYMGYVDDRCMANYSEGQRTAMRKAIVLSRTELILAEGCIPVGIEESSILNGISIYPNPSNGEFVINTPPSINLLDLSIDIVDLSGRKIDFQMSKTSNQINIAITTPVKGIYFMQINSKGQSKTMKLMLNY